MFWCARIIEPRPRAARRHPPRRTARDCRPEADPFPDTGPNDRSRRSRAPRRRSRLRPMHRATICRQNDARSTAPTGMSRRDIEHRAARLKAGFLRGQEPQEQRHALARAGNAKMLLATIELRRGGKVGHRTIHGKASSCGGLSSLQLEAMPRVSAHRFDPGRSNLIAAGWPLTFALPQLTAAFPRTTAGPATPSRRSRRGCRPRPGPAPPPRRSRARPRRRRPGPRSRGCAANPNPWS